VAEIHRWTISSGSALFLSRAILSQLELSQINGAIATPPRLSTIRKVFAVPPSPETPEYFGRMPP
jgi:hypothetical protein